jgi:drug/metabolite transporter (DMT)-like permease
MTIARPLARSRVRLSASPAGAYIALLVGVFCISFTAIFTKWAAMPGPVSAAYRMSVAALALTIPLWRQARQRGHLFPPGARWGMLGGLSFALNLALLNSALLLTSAATATLLDNTAPIWVGLGAMAFFRERLSWRYWAGLGLALAGAAVVTGFNPARELSLNPGDGLAFVGALFYAAYLLITQRGRTQLDTLSYLWLVAITAAVALWSLCLLLRLPLTGYGAHAYLAMVGVGLLSQVGGWLMINYALGHVSASLAVVVLLAQPVITGLLSIPLLGELLSGRQVLGGALELSGIYLCLRRKADEGRKSDHEQ